MRTGNATDSTIKGNEMTDSTQNRGREVWLPVVSYGGRYLDTHRVSTHRRVRSLDHWILGRDGRRQFIPGRMLSTKSGSVTMSKSGQRSVSVERLYVDAVAAVLKGSDLARWC